MPCETSAGSALAEFITGGYGSHDIWNCAGGDTTPVVELQIIAIPIEGFGAGKSGTISVKSSILNEVGVCLEKMFCELIRFVKLNAAAPHLHVSEGIAVLIARSNTGELLTPYVGSVIAMPNPGCIVSVPHDIEAVFNPASVER